MKDFLRTHNRLIEWALGVFVVVTSIVVWFENREPSEGLSIYDIFPPLGLIAFGLMWTHFVMGALRRFAGAELPKSSTYKTVSMGLVLALIILHPGLLWTGLYMDGLGLPPLSYLTAYSHALFAVVLGSTGLIIFLAFELKRWFGDKTWWRYVEWAQIVGMAAIFYHALNLGGEIRVDWFGFVWLFYGVTLVAAILYTKVIFKRKEEGYGKQDN